MNRTIIARVAISLAAVLGIFLLITWSTDREARLPEAIAAEALRHTEDGGEDVELLARLERGEAERGRLVQRIEVLEAQLRSLSRQRVEEPRELAEGQPGSMTDEAGEPGLDLAGVEDGLFAKSFTEELTALQELVLDSTQETGVRVDALWSLWQIDLRTGREGSRTAEMADLLLPLLAGEPDPDNRRKLCFHLLGVVEPRHRNYLLAALRSDDQPSVRAQAADTLQDLQGEADVRLALEWASLHDPDEEVRATALEMLSRYEGDDEN